MGDPQITVQLSQRQFSESPHELLLAALGSCTALTLKAYADRKAWALRDVRVSLKGEHTDAGFVITRHLVLDGDLDVEQRQRLVEIAGKCPVHKTLVGEIVINTTEGDWSPAIER